METIDFYILFLKKLWQFLIGKDKWKKKNNNGHSWRKDLFYVYFINNV